MPSGKSSSCGSDASPARCARTSSLSILCAAGFVDPSIEPTRVYDIDDARAFLASVGLDADVVAREVSGRILSAFVRARKPSDNEI